MPLLWAECLNLWGAGINAPINVKTAWGRGGGGKVRHRAGI